MKTLISLKNIFRGFWALVKFEWSMRDIPCDPKLMAWLPSRKTLKMFPDKPNWNDPEKFAGEVINILEMFGTQSRQDALKRLKRIEQPPRAWLRPKPYIENNHPIPFENGERIPISPGKPLPKGKHSLLKHVPAKKKKRKGGSHGHRRSH